MSRVCSSGLMQFFKDIGNTGMLFPATALGQNTKEQREEHQRLSLFPEEPDFQKKALPLGSLHLPIAGTWLLICSKEFLLPGQQSCIYGYL